MTTNSRSNPDRTACPRGWRLVAALTICVTTWVLPAIGHAYPTSTQFTDPAAVARTGCAGCHSGSALPARLSVSAARSTIESAGEATIHLTVTGGPASGCGVVATVTGGTIVQPTSGTILLGSQRTAIGHARPLGFPCDVNFRVRHDGTAERVTIQAAGNSVNLADGWRGDSPTAPAKLDLLALRPVVPRLEAMPAGPLAFVSDRLNVAPPPGVVSIRNAGGGHVAYTIASSQEWLTVEPPSGTSAGETRAHTIRVAPSARPGIRTGTLTIRGDAGATPITVEVRVSTRGQKPTFSIAESSAMPVTEAQCVVAVVAPETPGGIRDWPLRFRTNDGSPDRIVSTDADGRARVCFPSPGEEADREVVVWYDADGDGGMLDHDPREIAMLRWRRTPLVPLWSFHSAARNDYLTTADPSYTTCRDCSPPYRPQALEGYIYSARGRQPAGTVPLYRWWSPDRSDEFTTSNAAWAGRTRGEARREGSVIYYFLGVDGYIHDPALPQPPGTAPLRSYWSAMVTDNAATRGAAFPGGAVPATYGQYRTEGYMRLSPLEPRSIATGGFHACAAQPSGGVACWGDNSRGQLGNGTTGPSRIGLVVGVHGPVVELATGTLHTCALLRTGTVKCWGDNTFGQLGDGTTVGRSVAVNPGLSGVLAIAAGDSHTCAVVSGGDVYCWGAESIHAQGPGKRRPVQVREIGDAVGVAAGGTYPRRTVNGSPQDGEFSCALLASGQVKCWGTTGHGRLGTLHANYALAHANRPVPVHGVSGALQISAGDGHACAILAAGRIRCWGDNSHRQVGNGSPREAPARPQPVDVVLAEGAIAVEAGARHTCAVMRNGRVNCWGSNAHFQVGGDRNWDTVLPRTGSYDPGAVRGLAPAECVSAGSTTTCARSTNGSVWCWGRNNAGEIADGTYVESPVPVPVYFGGLRTIFGTGGEPAHFGYVPDSDDPYSEFWEANGHVCAGSSSEGLVCWNGGTSRRAANVEGLPVPSGADIRKIVGGFNHSCMLSRQGQVYCWGGNSVGQVGDGTNADREVPTRVAIDGVVDITAGAYHSCALTLEGTVRCWGDASEGQLGSLASWFRLTRPGGSSWSPLPEEVWDLRGVASVGAGHAHTCAVLLDGTIRCWGRNSGGQLGDGTTGGKFFPSRVLGLGRVVSVAGGLSHTCAQTSSEQVYCWGLNANGQLGMRGTLATVQPTTAAVPVSAIAVAASENRTCVIRTDGVLACWGKTSRGYDVDQPTPATTSSGNVLANRIGVAMYPRARADWGIYSLDPRTNLTRVAWSDSRTLIAR